MFFQWLVAITLACSILLPFQPVRFTTRYREVLCKDAMKLAPDSQWITVTAVVVCASFHVVRPSEQGPPPQFKALDARLEWCYNVLRVEYNADNLGVYFYDLRDPLSPEKQLLGRLPCSCADFTCGCCAGLRVRAYNFSRKACTNLTYDPLEFSLTMNMLINDNSVYSNSISAKNPPALCMPIIIPYLPTTFHLCMRLFNIFTPGSNLHACMDWEARVANKPVLILHFDCMRIGYDGVALLKPEDNGGIDFATRPTPSPAPPGEDEVYDEVLEDRRVCL